MKVGIGIATLNGFQRVDRLLSSIQQHTKYEGDYEIAVCDDGSAEADLKRLRNVCESYGVRLIEHEKNKGISATWNDLTRCFDTSLMVLLNDDLVMVDDWLRCMIYFMVNNRVGACGLPMWHGLAGDVKEKTSRRHYIHPYILEVKDKPIRCLYAPGPCFVFKRGLWKLLGGFDEQYLSFYEDSITKNRFVTVLNKQGKVEIVKIEELFNRYASGAENIVKPKGLKALTLDCPIVDSKWFMTSYEREVYHMHNSLEIPLTEISKSLGKSYSAVQQTWNRAKRKVKAKLAINLGKWAKVAKIIRRKTGKRVYRVLQKYGETCVTEDHSLITENFKETKPLDLGEKRLERIDRVPLVELIQRVDLWTFLREVAGMRCNDEEIWYTTRAYRDKIIRVKRFPDFDPLCRLIGAYVGEGSISEANYGYRFTIVSNNNMEWVKEIARAYSELFSRAAYIIDDNGRYHLNANDKLSAILFEKMCGRGSMGKKLPSFIYHLPEKYQRILLSTLIKGDGYSPLHMSKPDPRYTEEYNKKYFLYTSKSLELICGLSFLLTQLGCKYTIGYRESKDAYWIRNNTKFYYPTKNMTKVKEVPYEGYVYDLEVEGSHMFVDSCGQVLLHNSDFGSKMARLGWLSYVLPHPTIFHFWGATFAENPQLKHEYRMTESRRLYITRWDGDQGEVMNRYVYKWAAQKLKWIGEGGIEHEGEEVLGSDED